MAIIDKKQTRWYAKSTFDSLDKTTIPVGTEIQVAGEIEETDLTADLQTKINGKLTAPTTPTADSVVTMAANGTTGTKALSEIGGGKLYLHKVPFKKSDNAITVNITFYSLSDQPTSDSMFINITTSNSLLYKGTNNMGMPLVGVLYPIGENNFDLCDFYGLNLATGEVVEATSAKFIKQNEITMEI